MNTEYEIIEGLKAGYEEAYKYIYDRQYKYFVSSRKNM